MFYFFMCPISFYNEPNIKDLETLCILRNVKASRSFVFMNYSVKYFIEVFFHSLLV